MSQTTNVLMGGPPMVRPIGAFYNPDDLEGWMRSTVRLAAQVRVRPCACAMACACLLVLVCAAVPLLVYFNRS